MKQARKWIAMLLVMLLVLPGNVIYADNNTESQAQTEQVVEGKSAVDETKETPTTGTQDESTIQEAEVSREGEQETPAEEGEITEPSESGEGENNLPSEAPAQETESPSAMESSQSEVTTPVETEESETTTEAPVETSEETTAPTETKIYYNLGSKKVEVDFEDQDDYTIEIPESNPYFPYEVQFSDDGEHQDGVNKWFETPDSTVKFDGYTFSVSVQKDDDGNPVYSSLSLNIAGDDVLVYPEEKTFTNQSMNKSIRRIGANKRNTSKQSLDISSTLSSYSPLEMTMIGTDLIFQGQTVSGDKIAWKAEVEEKRNVQINAKGDKLDLLPSDRWELEVGNGDQLESNATIYELHVGYHDTFNFFTATVEKTNADNTKSTLTDKSSLDCDYVPEHYRYEYSVNFYEFYQQGLTVKDKFTTALSVKSEGRNLTSIKMKDFDTNKELTESNGKFLLDENISEENPKKILVEGYDNSGKKIGSMTVDVSMDYRYANDGPEEDYIWKNMQLGHLVIGLRNGNFYRDFKGYPNESYATGYIHYIATLYDDQALDTPYALVGTTYECGGYQSGNRFDKTINDEVIAAYAGNYASNDAAKAAGATDIKGQLFGADGYTANFKNGVDITIFVQPTKGMKSVYHYNLKAIHNLSSDTKVHFTGLKDKSGNVIDSYALEGIDSYGEGNYVVFIVKDQNADLSEVAPEFTLGYASSAQGDDSPITLYDSEKNEAQISGQSLHNFEGKSVQYTASSEDKRYQANYWVQVVKADPDKAVFITSANDKDSKTSYDANGTMTTTREVLLDDTHEYVHDILIINRGSSAIQKIKASLTDSDTLVLDDYFNLKGQYDLSDFSSTSWDSDKSNEWFANISVVRLKLKDYDSTEGKDIKGKLTLTSGNKTLAVINLTGTIGNPQIITETIPEAVKYVPYGAMIQNNNRYSDYVPGYALASGRLPDGMEIKMNGELYGVPKKTGTYRFTIRMYNRYPYQRSGTSERTYTLTVKDNTDPNVDGATDNGYKLKERVPDFRMSDSTQSYLFVSEGLFDNFKDVQKVFLDGELLTPGTDYTAESGSTRITLLASTLKKNGTGFHTIGVEFREKKDTDQEAKHNSVNKEEGTLKRAAQNYRINGRSSSHSSGGSSGGSSGSGSSYSNSLSNGNAAEKASPNTVGFTLMPPTPGNWVKDSKTGAWNFMMPDKTTKRTGWIVYNQHWYYLNKDGVMLTGWQFLGNAWYCFSMTKDSKEGMLLTSWHFTDNKWVYLSETDDIFMGQMLINRRTPDGYFVGPNGAWDGKSKS